MEDLFSLFSRDLELMTAELNKRKWCPFVAKSVVLRIQAMITNKWVELYRNKRREDNKLVLDRMNELERLYGERDAAREKLLGELLKAQKDALLKRSRTAFCHAVCKERAEGKYAAMCSCMRVIRYINALEKDFDEYMSKNYETLIKQFQEGPKWEETTNSTNKSC